MRKPVAMPPAFARLVVNDRCAEWNDNSTCGCVEDLDEGYEERVEAGEEAEVAADFCGAVAEVTCCQEEEGYPEQQEDAEDRLAEAKGDDPEEKGEDSPHEQDGASCGWWRGF